MKTTGGINYDQAYESCQSLSGQLFYFYNLNQFKQFQNQITSLSQSSYAESINLFFRVGAWINKHNSKIRLFFKVKKKIYFEKKSSAKI